MRHQPELLRSCGEHTANTEFLTVYKQAVLLVLQKNGVLDQEQLEECFSKVKGIQESPE